MVGPNELASRTGQVQYLILALPGAKNECILASRDPSSAHCVTWRPASPDSSAVTSNRRALHLAIAVTAVAGYLGLSYFAAKSEHPSLAATLFGITPLAAAMLMIAWNSRARWAALLVYALCLAAISVGFDRLQAHSQWLYFLQHFGAMCGLAVTFGATLGGEDDARALCSRMASRMLGGTSDAALMRYTWKVTLAWTVFFTLCALASVLLFAFGPIEAWSAFANLGTPLLLGAMFVGEYLIRQRALPAHASVTIRRIVETYVALTDSRKVR